MNIIIRFVAICLISLLISILLRVFLFSENVYFASLAHKLSYDQIEQLVDDGKKWEWLAYSLIPLIFFLKCSYAALCLMLGLFFIIDRFEFRKMLNISVKAEFIFLLPMIIKLFWFLFIHTNFTLLDLQFFYPLSVMNFLESQSLEPWLIYPFQVMNLFELFYWILLAYLISKEIPELDMNRSMTVVMSGYGTGLVIWVAFVMFLTLTYT